MKIALTALLVLTYSVFCGGAFAADFDMTRKLNELLAGIDGIKITALGDDDALIDGSVDSVDNMNRILAVVDGLKPHPVHNLVSLSKKGREELKARVEQEIATEGVHVRLVNNVLMLEGIVRNDFEADRAVEIAKTFINAPAMPAQRVPTSTVTHGGTTDTTLKNGPGVPIDAMPNFYSRNNLPTMLADILRVLPEPMKKGKR